MRHLSGQPTVVNEKIKICWDGQGTSYTPGEDKVYDSGAVSETEKNRRYKGFEGHTALLAADESSEVTEVSVHRKRSRWQNAGPANRSRIQGGHSTCLRLAGLKRNF